jgi:hypothetical protein
VRRVLLAVTLGVFTGPLLVALAVTVAHAYPSDCPSRYQEEVQNPTNGRGLQVDNPGIDVKDTVVNCARAVSLADVSSDEMNWTEFGWYEQVPPQGGNPYWLCTDTNGPKVLITLGTNGTPWCKPTNPNIPSGGSYDTYYLFRMSDRALDGQWTFKWSTDTIGTWNMGPFTTGQPRANAERKSTSDASNYAEFLGIQRMGHDSSNNPYWYDFATNVSNVWTSDPDYHTCAYNTAGYDNTQIFVKKGAC